MSKELEQKSQKFASNVTTNVTVIIDKDVASEVLVEVLRDAQVVRNIGAQGVDAILNKFKPKEEA